MILTGCESIKDIDSSIIRNVNTRQAVAVPV